MFSRPMLGVWSGIFVAVEHVLTLVVMHDIERLFIYICFEM